MLAPLTLESYNSKYESLVWLPDLVTTKCRFKRTSFIFRQLWVNVASFPSSERHMTRLICSLKKNQHERSMNWLDRSRVFSRNLPGDYGPVNGGHLSTVGSWGDQGSPMLFAVFIKPDAGTSPDRNTPCNSPHVRFITACQKNCLQADKMEKLIWADVQLHRRAVIMQILSFGSELHMNLFHGIYSPSSEKLIH